MGSEISASTAVLMTNTPMRDREFSNLAASMRRFQEHRDSVVLSRMRLRRFTVSQGIGETGITASVGGKHDTKEDDSKIMEVEEV